MFARKSRSRSVAVVLALFMVLVMIWGIRSFVGDDGGIAIGSETESAGSPAVLESNRSTSEPKRSGDETRAVAASFHLRVVDRDGAPIAGARIDLAERDDQRYLTGEQIVMTAISGDDGRADLGPERPEGRKELVCVEARGFETRSFLLEGRGPAEVRLMPGFDQDIRVVDGEGRPVAAVRVYLGYDQFSWGEELSFARPARRYLPGAVQALRIAVTDESGLARFSGLEEGRYWCTIVDVDHDAGEPADSGSEIVTVPGLERSFKVKAMVSVAVARRDTIGREIIGFKPLMRVETARGIRAWPQEHRPLLKRLERKQPDCLVMTWLMPTARDLGAKPWHATCDVWLQDGVLETLDLDCTSPSEILAATELDFPDGERGQSGRVHISLVSPSGRRVDGREFRVVTDWPEGRKGTLGFPLRTETPLDLPAGDYRIGAPRFCPDALYDPAFKVTAGSDEEVTIRLTYEVRDCEIYCRSGGRDCEGFGAFRVFVPLSDFVINSHGTSLRLVLPVGKIEIESNREGFRDCRQIFEVLPIEHDAGASVAPQRLELELEALSP